MLCAKLPRHIGAARVRVKPINFQTETLPAIRKKAVFGHQSADNFSELSLMEKTLPLPFHTVFVGIETPESDVLTGIDKAHNASLPMLEAIDTLNRHGLEVTSGIIMGLDLETDESEAKLIEWLCCKDDRRRWEDGDKLDPISFMRRYRKER
jgi:radical SAM superfamily enzyme YgiQ (UPF0313 family)